MEASRELGAQYPPEKVLVEDGIEISFTQWLVKSRDARVGTLEEQAKIFEAIEKNPDGFHF